jgi:hypothetical protein
MLIIKIDNLDNSFNLGSKVRKKFGICKKKRKKKKKKKEMSNKERGSFHFPHCSFLFSIGADSLVPRCRFPRTEVPSSVYQLAGSLKRTARRQI